MNAIVNETIKVTQGRHMREGVSLSDEKNAVEICIWCKDAKKCKLLLYRDNKLMDRIPMFSMQNEGAPDLFSVRIEGEEVVSYLKNCEYSFEADKKIVNDPFMRATAGRDVFGKKGQLRGRFYFEQFDWSGEKRKPISYDDMILYQCHLRGFTKHVSSKVKNPGTFSGFVEKLNYLQKLGVNSILFLPLYDFNERMSTEEKKINFWGYSDDACYFAPKASYAVDGSQAVDEFKSMIKKAHQKGMNLFMDMHFVQKSPDFILQCLKYYVTEFHIDGFLVNTDVVNKGWIDHDPVLRQCKFLGNRWDQAEKVNGKKTFGCFNDDFLTVARRYLKSDEGQVSDFFQSFKADSSECGIVHYITQKNGFTLRDLVSYDVKHNEANGEHNKDGTEYNYSWNCGQEGISRKKAVKSMRLQQTKNALCMLLLGLATPMILAGDEIGRTQKGNNNAYCQDNATTWMDWSLFEKNKEVFEFTKMLIHIRNTNPLYQRSEPISSMDTGGIGVPGVSGHGIEPWEANYSYYSREIGILFYGTYYKGKSLYFAFNFHWDIHEFFLPAIDEKNKWTVLLDTGRTKIAPNEDGINHYEVLPRSIVVFENRNK